MLSLRSCSYFGRKSLISTSFLSRFLLSKKPSLISISPFSSKANRNPRIKYLEMSDPPPPKNAFAMLMGNRPNAKKKPQSPSPSPSKKDPKTLTEDALKVEAVTEDGPLAKKPKTLEGVKEESKEVKKEDKSVNLGEKIALLKKKGLDFKPKSVAFWKDGESIPFMFLARAFDLISNESSRIVITDILGNVFRTVIATTPGDLVSFVYLSACKIYPAHDGIELGIGDAAIIKSLSEAYGKSETQIKKELKKEGDLGLVAKASRSSQSTMFKPAPLTVAKVLDTFRILAKVSGKDSQERKRNHIKALLVAASDCEPLYIIRLLQSKLRIGLAEQTVLVALAQAAAYSERPSDPPIEEAVKVIKQVYSVHPKYDTIVSALLSDGVLKLPDTCTFVPGVPIGPMLAKPTKGVSEILDKFQNRDFTCEYKYDGERAQIHYLEDGSVEIYSRNAERNTGKFPDVIQSVQRFKKPSVSSFVLDCEVVAFDRKNSKILSFQKLSNRARKDVSIDDITVQVCIFAFDILYLNGEQLLQEQLNVRRKHLYDSFVEVPGEFKFATEVTSNDLEAIQTFLDTAIVDSCEGLIVKTLSTEATYEPAKRSNNWLKLKKDYMDNIGDSLDLVPIGAYHGRGKRTGGYGGFLLACYDDEKEEFQCICKIGTGFSEKMLEERSSSLESQVIPQPKSYYRFTDATNPDVWFEPTEVWEVKAADLSISPVYLAAAGAVDAVKGISLRFPRLLRVREDKKPEEATTSDQVADMYRAQKINHGNNQDEEDDN
ncbi:DNA ligase 1-like [Papaver somniferum]|uniref:DNA ligase 1-like n=1 Tax=Papaver somniferum TaxID=3469 RepID=UPI000E70145B|nr:DNA ligase 1-like [Papaver somniferum]